MRGGWALVGVCALLLGAAAWGAAEVVTAQRGTLHHLGGWHSAKIGPAPDVPLARGLVGAISFVTSRPALARDRLNLGAWHGYQEVWLARPVELESIAFDLRLSADAYVVLLFDGAADGFAGVRLSRHEAVPSLCFQADPARRFTAQAPLAPGPPALGDGWHRLRLERDGARFAVRLDGARLGACGAVRAGPQSVGFRGGPGDAWVDDVEIREVGGAAPLREDFRSRPAFAAVFAGAFVLLAAASAALFVFARRRGGRGNAPLFAAFGLCLVLALGATAAWGVDRFVLAGRYPPRTPTFGYPVSSEKEEDVRARIDARVAAAPDAQRILVLGGSQTWGAGAERARDVFSARLEERLRRDGRAVRVLNAGIPGYASPRLAALYASRWLDLEPALVVANLSNNDADTETFRRNLRRIAALNQERGIATVFVLEPNSPEVPYRHLAYKHAAMREVAEELGVPLVDMHARLAARNGEGFLWWDHVHLTSLGHALFAEELYAAIEPALASR